MKTTLPKHSSPLFASNSTSVKTPSHALSAIKRAPRKEPTKLIVSERTNLPFRYPRLKLNNNPKTPLYRNLLCLSNKLTAKKLFKAPSTLSFLRFKIRASCWLGVKETKFPPLTRNNKTRLVSFGVSFQ